MDTYSNPLAYIYHIELIKNNINMNFDLKIYGVMTDYSHKKAIGLLHLQVTPLEKIGM